MVQQGVIDVGTVRSDTIERMAAEGKCTLSDFRILNQQDGSFPFVHSTELYPEWPMARCADTDPVVAEKIASALKAMPTDSEAAKAAKCLGWVDPLDYSKVRQLLTSLQLGAFASN